MSQSTIRPPVPELEACKLYKRVTKARIAAERAEATLTQVQAERAAAYELLDTTLAEYRAVRDECVA